MRTRIRGLQILDDSITTDDIKDQSLLYKDFDPYTHYDVMGVYSTPPYHLLYYRGYPNIIIPSYMKEGYYFSEMPTIAYWGISNDLKKLIHIYSYFDYVIFDVGFDIKNHGGYSTFASIVDAYLHSGLFKFIYLEYKCISYDVKNLEVFLDTLIQLGVNGICFSEFTYAEGLNRQNQNTALSLALERSLDIIIKGQDCVSIFGNEVDPTYNPDGTLTLAKGPRFGWLYDECIVNTSYYKTYSNPYGLTSFYTTYQQIIENGLEFKKDKGIRVYGLNTVVLPTQTFSFNDSTGELVLIEKQIQNGSLFLGLDGYGVCALYQGAADNRLFLPTYPKGSLCSKFRISQSTDCMFSFNTSTGEYERTHAGTTYAVKQVGNFLWFQTSEYHVDEKDINNNLLPNGGFRGSWFSDNTIYGWSYSGITVVKDTSTVPYTNGVSCRLQYSAGDYGYIKSDLTLKPQFKANAFILSFLYYIPSSNTKSFRCRINLGVTFITHNLPQTTGGYWQSCQIPFFVPQDATTLEIYFESYDTNIVTTSFNIADVCLNQLSSNSYYIVPSEDKHSVITNHTVNTATSNTVTPLSGIKQEIGIISRSIRANTNYDITVNLQSGFKKILNVTAFVYSTVSVNTQPVCYCSGYSTTSVTFRLRAAKAGTYEIHYQVYGI